MPKLLRSIALAFLLTLPTATTVHAGDLSDALREMSDEDREIFDQEVRRYLLENPEIIREAIELLEVQRREAEVQADAGLVARNKGRLLSDGFSFVGGNPDGDVTIVEFSDYRCGFCKRAHPAVKELLERDPNVRLVVKEFPILGPESVAAARMALAAQRIEPEKFAALNDALMGFRGDLTEAMAYRIAGQVGYNIAELKTQARDRVIEEQIAQTFELARDLGLEGTPSFVIGNEIIRGFVPLEDMLASVNDARQALN